MSNIRNARATLRQSKELAVDRYITHLEAAREHMERITEYLEDFGELGPDDINWAHVGSMEAFARALGDLHNRIDKTGEYA